MYGYQLNLLDDIWSFWYKKNTLVWPSVRVLDSVFVVFNSHFEQREKSTLFSFVAWISPHFIRRNNYPLIFFLYII